MVVVVASMLTVGVSLTSSPAEAATASCAPLDPFTTDWVDSYLASVGTLRVAAAVEDVSTGCTSRFGPTDGFPTASTVKAEIMGATFLSLQDQGATSVDPGTDALLSAMIEQSDNTAATTLYDDLGGGAALQAFGRRLGMTTTDNADYAWGDDATNPDDQVRLLDALLVGGGALDANWVAQAGRYMGSIEPDEAWGVSAGVPAGSTVFLKNGWLPNDGTVWQTGDAWRVNSIGVVRLPNEREYVLAVYGDQWATMDAGIAAIQTVSARVASVLSAPRSQAPAATLLAASTGDTGAVFTAVSPTRLLDTRTSSGPVPGGGEVTVDIARGGPAPSSVAVNITAVDATSAGYVTVWPDGAPAPLASTLNQQPGRVVANLAVVAVGVDRKIRLHTSVPTDLVVDLLGTWTPHTGAATAGRYQTVTPARLLDTRTNATTLRAGTTTTVAVLGRGGVPAAGASAAVLNVTVTNAAGAGYWTVWPTGTPRPTASTLNTTTGDTLANATIVPLGGDGSVSVFAQTGGDLVVDVTGYITDATAAASTAGRLVALAAPVRAVDTRFGIGGLDRLAAGSTSTVDAPIPDDAIALAAVVTTTDPGTDGYLTVYPPGAGRPTASSANPSVSLITWANSLITGAAASQVDVYSLGTTELIVDVSGWFTP